MKMISYFFAVNYSAFIISYLAKVFEFMVVVLQVICALIG